MDKDSKQSIITLVSLVAIPFLLYILVYLCNLEILKPMVAFIFKFLIPWTLTIIFWIVLLWGASNWDKMSCNKKICWVVFILFFSLTYFNNKELIEYNNQISECIYEGSDDDDNISIYNATDCVDMALPHD